MHKISSADLRRRGGSFWSFWWRQLLLMVLTITANKNSQGLSFQGTEGVLIFPPLGAGLALMLLWGVRRTWLGMVIGAAWTSLPPLLQLHGPVRGSIVAVAAITATVVPVVLGAVWFRRSPYSSDPLGSVAGILWLVVVGGVLTYGVDAAWQGATFWLAGSVPDHYGSVLVNFWVLGISNTVSIGFLYLAWWHPWPIERPWLVAGMVVTSVLVGWFVFWLPTAHWPYFEYGTVLVVVWAAFVLGRRGAILSAVILGGMLVVASGVGRGRYTLQGQHEVNMKNFYTISIALTGVIVAAVLQERAKSVEEILRLNRELEERVAQRTAALAQSNQELEKTNQELEKTNQDLEAFSYSVSHDLRAPLRHIHGFAQILQEDYLGTLDAQGQRYLGVVCHSAARMGYLIDDLLAFSRVSRLEIRLEPVDMTGLVQEVFSELREDVPERKINLTVGVLPTAVGDHAMVRQVLTNLLGNAIKYTEGRAVADIGMSCVVEGSEQVYSVNDNGVGFDMRDADRLFGVFQRLQAARQFEGTGIGLAIVQRVVERHGGRVWAEGQVDQGATFYFTLPSARNHRRIP